MLSFIEIKQNLYSYDLMMSLKRLMWCLFIFRWGLFFSTEGLKVTGKKTVADYCNELSKKSGDAALWSPSVRHLNSMQLIESTPTRIPSTPITRVCTLRSKPIHWTWTSWWHGYDLIFILCRHSRWVRRTPTTKVHRPQKLLLKLHPNQRPYG